MNTKECVAFVNDGADDTAVDFIVATVSFSYWYLCTYLGPTQNYFKTSLVSAAYHQQYWHLEYVEWCLHLRSSSCCCFCQCHLQSFDSLNIIGFVNLLIFYSKVSCFSYRSYGTECLLMFTLAITRYKQLFSSDKTLDQHSCVRYRD